MNFGAVSGTLRHAALTTLVFLSAFATRPDALGGNLTLAWDPTTDPAVAGYRLYYGTGSRTYTNAVDAGSATMATISNLVGGVTYYFAATTYSTAGLESDYSAEASYTPTVVNYPPTLDPIADVTIAENSGLQTVTLYGISSGAFTENQTLTVTAFSSNPSLIPNPTVNYVSPQQSGSLSFTPVAGAYGASTMTVMVDDGGTVSNTVIQVFTVTVTPVNNPPTLDSIADLTISENAGTQTISLTGITSGASNETQTLIVSASSSNPTLVPDPVVTYVSPNTTGSLALTPVTNAFGSATITVTVNDGQSTNNLFSRLFTLTVNQVTVTPNLMTNAIVPPNQNFRFALNPPYTNGHKFNFALDSTAPAGARINNRRGVPTFMWSPTLAQASTTNLITVIATDNTTLVSTNEYLQVIVADYVLVYGNSVAVQAGQSATLPVAVVSSDGVTNISFTMSFPTNKLVAPTFTSPAPTTLAGSCQLQGTNLLVQVRSVSGQALTGSNVVALINFQAVAGQPSAFVSLGFQSISGSKPSGLTYIDNWSQSAQVTIVNGQPLLESTISGNSRVLRLYGAVGVNYALQSSTNLQVTNSWTTVTTYLQTNVAQTFGVDSGNSLIFYRLQQQ